MTVNSLDIINWYYRYCVTATDMTDLQQSLYDHPNGQFEGLLSGAVVSGFTPATGGAMAVSISAGIAISASGYLHAINQVSSVTLTAPTGANPTRNLVVVRPLVTQTDPMTNPTDPFSTVYLKDNYASQIVLIAGTAAASPTYPSTESNDVVLFGLRGYNGQTVVNIEDIDLTVRESAGKNSGLLQQAAQFDDRLRPYRSTNQILGVKPSQLTTSSQRQFVPSTSNLGAIFPKNPSGKFNSNDTFLNFQTGAISGGDGASAAFTPTIPSSGNAINATVVMTTSNTLAVSYGTAGTRAQCFDGITNQRTSSAGSVNVPSTGRPIAFVTVYSGNGTSVTEIDFIDARGINSNLFNGTGLFDDGSLAAPSISFSLDTDTGFYRIGSGSVGFVANGVLAGSWASTYAWTLGASTGQTASNTVRNQSTGNSALIVQSGTDASARGLHIRSGPAAGAGSSSDYPLIVSNSATTADYLVLQGDGSLKLYNNSNVLNFSIDSNGVLKLGRVPGATASTLVHYWYGKTVTFTQVSSNSANVAPTAIADAYYLKIGGGEYATNSYRLIGFGYQNPGVSTYLPAFVGYQETDVSGSTGKGRLIFATRNVTTDSAPTICGKVEPAAYWILGDTAKIASSDYVGQQLVGKTDAVAVAAGYIGELITATPAGIAQASPVNGTYYDDSGTLALTPGRWRIYAGMTTYVVGSSSPSGSTVAVLKAAIRTGSTIIAAAVTCSALVNGVPCYGFAGILHEVNISANTTYKMSVSWTPNSGSPTVSSIGLDVDPNTTFYAVRVA